MKQSEKLLKFSNLSHGFGTRDEKWSERDLVLPEQIHGNKIALVNKGDVGKRIKGADGLITNEAKVKIGVRTADCVPVIFFEPVKKIVGVVHAGWRGTLDKIARNMVLEIKKLGGNPQNLVAAIGPHIGMCCYDIPQERADLFTQQFGLDFHTVSPFADGSHLDLAYVNSLQLLEAGIRRENLDVPPSCTFCQKDLFSSFRRSKKEGGNFEEMLSFISFI